MKDADNDFFRVENSAKGSPWEGGVWRPVGSVRGRLVMFGNLRGAGLISAYG